MHTRIFNILQGITWRGPTPWPESLEIKILNDSLFHIDFFDFQYVDLVRQELTVPPEADLRPDIIRKVKNLLV